MKSLRLRRSKLFVPGNRPDFMAKALSSAADGLSLDLEDAVAEDQKDVARKAICAFLDGLTNRRKEISVRVNGVTGDRFIDDVLTCARKGLDIINVPKVEDPYELRVADTLLRYAERKAGLDEGSILLVPTLESAKGLRCALDIALASPRVTALQLGTGDLKAATGLVPDTQRLGPVRILLMLACAEAGVDALDSAYVRITDVDGFRADASEARMSGFRGKSCIHPTQVPIANLVFAPSPDELRFAASMVKAYDDGVGEGRGAIQYEGMLVDYPIAEEARRLIEASRATQT